MLKNIFECLKYMSIDLACRDEMRKFLREKGQLRLNILVTIK